MKQATFAEGVVIALISSIAIAAIFSVMSSFYLGESFLRLTVAMLSFAYIIYLLMRTKERIGRVTAMLAWFVITSATLVFVPSVFVYLVTQLLLIWLLRSLYFYNSLFSSFCDLGLMLMSVLIAFWTWSVTSSVFLTFWCFFLMQALFVFIPKNIFSKRERVVKEDIENDRFEYAHQAAETALAKLLHNN